MAMNAKITIAGCGPGSADYLAPATMNAARSADVLAGSRRLLELFADFRGERIVVDAHIEPLLDQIAVHAQAGRKVTVLVSGDVGAFSLAATVVKRFGRANCTLIPAVSSVQAAFAAVALDWVDARVISAHGRQPQCTAAELATVRKIAILAGTAAAMQWSATLAGELAATHTAILCEDLTLDSQRVRELSPAELAAGEASSLSIVLLIDKKEFA